MPVRVLHLGNPTPLYGAERWILALIRHLPAEYVESVVGVIKDEPGGDPELCVSAAALGVPTKVFEAHGRLSAPAVPQLRRYIRDADIGILHTHGYKTDVIGWLAAVGTPCRVIATPHGWSTNAGSKLRLYEAFDRLVFRFLDAVVPLSVDLHADLRGRMGMAGRLHLIENGVDLTEIDAAQCIVDEIVDFKQQGEVIVGYVGQLIRRKRVDTLLHAFKALSFPNKRLFILGEGAQRRELEELAEALEVSDRTHFVGFREDRLSFVKGFDLFVLPSELEGIPRCVLEAMAMGVPVIATDIPGCRDIVTDRVTGRLYQSGDVPGLLNAIESLMRSDAMRAEVGSAGADFVRRHYSANAMADNYVSLYRKIADIDGLMRSA